MKTTASQGLPYPLSPDLGAGARQMQDLAELLETKFNAIDGGWTLRRNPPTWIALTTSNQNANEIIPATWHTVDFDNTGVLAPINSGLADTGKLTATPGKTELWWIGAFIVMTSIAPADAVRRGRLLVTSLEPVTAARTLQVVDQTHYETLSSNENLCWDGLVRVTADATVQLVTVGGASQVSSGAVMWATRVGQE